jgi:hypothetical protein
MTTKNQDSIRGNIATLGIIERSVQDEDGIIHSSNLARQRERKGIMSIGHSKDSKNNKKYYG